MKRSEEGEAATVRRLRNRFLERQDDYLTRASMDNDEGRRRTLQIIDEIADRLEMLKVRVNRKTLALEPTGADEK